MSLLNLKNVKSEVEGKEILKGVDLTINKGEVHVIMGPNGAGKSTLASILVGHPKHEVVGGQILLEGEDITELEVDERAQKGIFLSFQYPEEIPGLTVEDFLRTDSGLDIDATKIVFEGVQKLKTKDTALLIITHYDKVLEYLKPDFVHVLMDGKIVKSGGIEIVEAIEKDGYGKMREELGL